MSDTFPDETLYPVLTSIADEDRIFASNSAAGHESSQIKGSTIKGLITALAGTPPETLDTLAKLASAINDDPNFHSTLATALGLKQNASNAVTTDGNQVVTGAKTFRATNLYYGPAEATNHDTFKFGCGSTQFWRFRQNTNGDLVIQCNQTGSSVWNNALLFAYQSSGTIPYVQLYNAAVCVTQAAADNSTKIASTAFVQAQKVDTALTGTPTAPTAAVGTNTTQLATTAFVQGALAGAAGIPAGVICMWSGTIATVPTGWALCDGANGTPDLVDRFVVAAGVKSGGDKYDPGDTGGLDSVTLDLTQVPAHTHAGTTAGGGAHTHVVGVPFWSGASGAATMIDKRDAADDDPAFSATASVSPVSDHTHTFSTDSKGGGQSHENRPPYYALAFIMKL